MKNSTSNVTIDSNIVIGNGSITPELSDQGYIATLCFVCQIPKNDYSFKDFNVTRKHLEILKSNIDDALNQLDSIGDS